MSKPENGRTHETVRTISSLFLLGVLMLMSRFIGQEVRPIPIASVATRPNTASTVPKERGRAAATPSELGIAGWRDILSRTYAELQKDRLVIVSAGIAFYGLLAIFPGITALVSIYGLFASSSSISSHLQQLSFLLPPDAFSIVDDQIRRVVSQGESALGVKFAIGLATALWSANAGMKGLIDGLNVAYEEEEKRSFINLNLLSFCMTAASLFSIAGLIVVVAALPAVFDSAVSSRATVLGLTILRWPFMLGLIVLGLAVLYKFGPSRQQAQWRWVSWGAAFAAISIAAVSFGLSWYLSNLADYNKTYGSLGAVIGLLLWMWLCGCAILIGAELNAEMEHQTAKDTTTGAPLPMGSRGSTMADTLGESTH